MQCWKCGMVLDEDSHFCTECGANQYERPIEETDELECPRCGSPVGALDSVCPICGYEWKKKKKGSKVVVVVVIAVLAVCLLAAVGVFLARGVLQKRSHSLSGGDGQNIEIQSNSSQTGGSQSAADAVSQTDTEVQVDVSSQSVTEATVGNVIPVETAEQTEDPHFWENALDAINNSSISLDGIMIEESAGVYFLNLSSPVTVCTYNENGQKQRVENISRVRLYQGSQSVSLSDHNEDVIQAAGAFRIRGQLPELTVYEMNVLQAKVREEDIHTYKVMIEDCTWEEAFSHCRSMGGYLLRLNSLEEFYYVTQLIDNTPGTDKIQFYIGARRDPGSDSYYLTDENNTLMGSRLDNGYTEWMSSIWLTGEPSYRDSSLGIEESYVSMFRYGDDRRWVINDVPNDLIAALSYNQGKIGYICELD